jgi:hypothetical protein
MRAPVKRPKLVVIELRVIEARKIVARQQALVDKLRTCSEAEHWIAGG